MAFGFLFVIIYRKQYDFALIERKGVCMGDDGFRDGGWYPHDGEGKIDNCPGPGCDCDERNYGYRDGGHRNSSSGKSVWIAIIAGLIIGYGFNELIGAMIIIGAIIYMFLFK
jgi:hypothetical protein